MALSAAPRYHEWLDDAGVDRLSESVHDPPAVRKLRRAALRSFRELDAEPNPLYRKYVYFGGVDLHQIEAALPGPPVAVPGAPAHTIRVVHDASGSRVELPAELSSAGVTVQTLPELWRDGEAAAKRLAPEISAQDKMGAFSLALVNRAVRIEVPDRCTLPVRVQDISVLSRPHEALVVHRSLRAGEASRLLYSEEVFSADEATVSDQRLYGSIVELDVAAEAAVNYATIHAPDLGSVGLYHRHATVARSAQLTWMWNGLGGFRTRLKNLTEIPGVGGDVVDLQTCFGQKQQSYDTSVQISHQGTDTHGLSMTRGLFRDDARGVSRGLVRIEKEARKTLSVLSEHAMLLSHGARSDTIPVLEILCRDVKATHSSSVAPVDPERIFYLESRGIAEQDAIRMIGEGFLGHVLERSPISGLREIVYPLLESRWDQKPILWRSESFPALPPLSVASATAPEEWRFDAKLR
ncbi:MAG: SufD family Fe-S cluster assembly protein [Thermoplasmata archaeon]|nr:SufD family Fe-S cluster assembly protein [Thermoplasmata archaeon]